MLSILKPLNILLFFSQSAFHIHVVCSLNFAQEVLVFVLVFESLADDLLGPVVDFVHPEYIDDVQHARCGDQHKPDKAQSCAGGCTINGPDFVPVWRNDQYSGHEEHQGHGHSIEEEGE